MQEEEIKIENKRINESQEILNIVYQVYPLGEGEPDHYVKGVDCECGPQIAWDGFYPLLYHSPIKPREE